MAIALKPGSRVVLLSRPTGYLSQHYPLTVGNTYTVQYIDGSNVVTTSDEPGCTASYHRGRVRREQTESEHG